MADRTSPTDPTPHDPADASAGEAGDKPALSPEKRPGKTKPRRRRRWLWVLGGLLLVLLALVALLPTIASTAWVRSMVVARANKGLNGRLVIDDWSVSWTGGIKVTGLRIFDAQTGRW